MSSLTDEAMKGKSNVQRKTTGKTMFGNTTEAC